MFKIFHGTTTLYSPDLAEYDDFAIYNPRLTFELNKAGSFTFTMPKSNMHYDEIEILKSWIRVYQDNKEIFRGRVMDVSIDTYLQKTVYVEGDLAYLNDSIQRPYEFEGAATALFSMLINKHNEQAEEDHQFQIGNVTAISASDLTHVKANEYSDTFSEITNRLINVYGGYIKTRYGYPKTYIDYLKDGDEGSAQGVTFGVNLVSLDAGGNSTDIFNVLIPLGAAVKGEDGEMKPLGVESLNGGKDYIEDAYAIEKYGRRIVRTYTWSHIEDANELLQKAHEYLAFGIAENATLTIRAVDMHLLDGSIDKISLGDMVNINAQPHGITRPEICARIDIDLVNPENTVYTFGKPKTALTENVVQLIKKMGGGGGGGMGTGLEEETLWLERWAEVYQDENEAIYEILTGQIDNITGRVSDAEILLDGVEANITLVAEEYNKLDASLKNCYSLVEVNSDNINLHSQSIEGINKDLASANLRIDGVEGSITTLTEKQEEVDGELVTLKSSISQNAGNITLLSEKYSGLDADIKECYSQIEVNTDSINLHSESINTLNGSITSANLRIDGVEGSITTLTEKQEEVDGELVTLKSSISQNAGNITLLSEKYSGLDADIKECYSQIEVNTDSINLHSESINTLNGSITSANLRIDGVAGSITSLTEKQEEIDGELVTMKSSISQNAQSISSKVSKGSIISEINQSAEAVMISASKINLSGYVTASDLYASMSEFLMTESLVIDAANLTADVGDISILKASSFTLANNNVKIGTLTMGALVSEKVLSTSTSVDLAHSHAVSVSEDGTVTLGEVSETGGNFRIADTKAYKDGVSAARNGVTLSSAGWINGVNTVTASNGKTYPVSLPAFTTWVNPNFDTNHKTRAYFYTASVSSTLASAEIDASSVYEEGYEAGVATGGNVTLSSAGWINGVNTVTASNGASYDVELPDFSVSTTSFNAQHKAIVYFSTQSVNQPLKSVEVDASGVYDSGYEDGYMDGWAAAAAVFNMAWSGAGNYENTLTITHAGATFGSASVKETLKVTVSCDISNITNPAQGVLYASAAARAYTNVNSAGAIQRAYANDTTQTAGSLG